MQFLDALERIEVVECRFQRWVSAEEAWTLGFRPPFAIAAEGTENISSERRLCGRKQRHARMPHGTSERNVLAMEPGQMHIHAFLPADVSGRASGDQTICHFGWREGMSHVRRKFRGGLGGADCGKDHP